MTIQLPPKIEALIDEQIARGRYASAAEVIEAAVRLLEERERRLEHLRSLLLAAEEETRRGDVVEWTPELRRQIRREAEEMARQGTSGDLNGWP